MAERTVEVEREEQEGREREHEREKLQAERKRLLTPAGAVILAKAVLVGGQYREVTLDKDASNGPLCVRIDGGEVICEMEELDESGWRKLRAAFRLWRDSLGVEVADVSGWVTHSEMKKFLEAHRASSSGP